MREKVNETHTRRTLTFIVEMCEQCKGSTSESVVLAKASMLTLASILLTATGGTANFS